jgi:phenylpropionate dioxygenase-like ring-hydroxylating dioxygenase large terminal subunit
MGVPGAIRKIRGGYPGGWREYARGYQGNKTPEFVPPTSADDRRSQIPPLGLREYWYPALLAKDVGWEKPVGARMLGDDLVFFRDKNGEVQALWDYCPHRGVYLSWGDSFWKGYLSCPYHGATFNGDGECVEFITEGPDSKMVGHLKAKKFPTFTVKGVVFVWMGESDPVPPEEDLPPELFEGPETLVFTSWRYWEMNWMVALENQDAHVGFLVHRNSLIGLKTNFGIVPRSPTGNRPKIINNRTMYPQPISNNHYAENGKLPYRMYYPRVGGYWPKGRWRLLWTWFTGRLEGRMRKRPPFETPPEWYYGTLLPGIVRIDYRSHMYTRWSIPVEKDLTRVLYFHSARPKGLWGRFYERVQYKLFHEWEHNFNFSDQDLDAQRSMRWQYPEYLSSSDVCIVAFRRLVTEHARGLNVSIDVHEQTSAERLVAEADEAWGVEPYEGITAGPVDSPPGG